MPGTIRKPAAKKAPAARVFEFEADLNRETPGTFRMDELAEKEDQISGSFYLKKTGLDGVRPKRVKVTVEVLEEQA